MVGAVLTQNTNWQNVTVAIERLRQGDFLRFERLSAISETELAELIRPSGYYNVKARRLLNLMRMIAEFYEGSPQRLLDDELLKARERLLAVTGIGEETADSILLYAGGQPIFVVDAYTYRICYRHQLIGEESDYQSLQDLFMDNLSPDADLFNDYHALLVMTGKHYCKKKEPLCEQCPLRGG
ncbi:MAG: endonuclease III domain-containing protein [Desulfofustis sp.]|nr:endonuclease III domain-containing protein [Desulfofustis sp.]